MHKLLKREIQLIGKVNYSTIGFKAGCCAGLEHCVNLGWRACYCAGWNEWVASIQQLAVGLRPWRRFGFTSQTMVWSRFLLAKRAWRRARFWLASKGNKVVSEWAVSMGQKSWCLQADPSVHGWRQNGKPRWSGKRDKGVSWDVGDRFKWLIENLSSVHGLWGNVGIDLLSSR